MGLVESMDSTLASITREIRLLDAKRNEFTDLYDLILRKKKAFEGDKPRRKIAKKKSGDPYRWQEVVKAIEAGHNTTAALGELGFSKAAVHKGLYRARGNGIRVDVTHVYSIVRKKADQGSTLTNEVCTDLDSSELLFLNQLKAHGSISKIAAQRLTKVRTTTSFYAMIDYINDYLAPAGQRIVEVGSVDNQIYRLQTKGTEER